jgi:hypothetical protein
MLSRNGETFHNLLSELCRPHWEMRMAPLLWRQDKRRSLALAGGDCLGAYVTAFEHKDGRRLAATR